MNESIPLRLRADSCGGRRAGLARREDLVRGCATIDAAVGRRESCAGDEWRGPAAFDDAGTGSVGGGPWGGRAGGGGRSGGGRGTVTAVSI
jgi:hypothetical protein